MDPKKVLVESLCLFVALMAIGVLFVGLAYLLETP